MELSTVHRTSTGKEKVDDKAPRVLGPADTIIHTREEGTTVQLCGDSEVAKPISKIDDYVKHIFTKSGS